jgi:hypothetical protein
MWNPSHPHCREVPAANARLPGESVHGSGQASDPETLTKRDRRVAARTKATTEPVWPRPTPKPAPGIHNQDEARQTGPETNDADAGEHTAMVIPLGVFDPYEEAKKRW